MGKHRTNGRLPSAGEDLARARLEPDTLQPARPAIAWRSPTWTSLLRDELRPVCLQLELLKPEMLLSEHRIDSTVTVFGSARLPAPEAADGRSRKPGCVLDPERTYAAGGGVARMVSRAMIWIRRSPTRLAEPWRCACSASQRPRLVAQHVFLNLAGRGLGQIGEDHGPRALEAGEERAAVLDQGLLGG
jgi:hypothetical protein